MHTARICCCSVLTPYSLDPPLLRFSPGVCARSAARRSMSSSEEDPPRPEGSDGNTREKLTRQSPPVQCRGVPRPPTGRGEMALRSQETSPAGGRRHQGLEDPDEQEGGWPGRRSCGPGGNSATRSGTPRQQHNPHSSEDRERVTRRDPGCPPADWDSDAAGTSEGGQRERGGLASVLA